MLKRIDGFRLGLAVFISMPSIVLAQDLANMGTVIAVLGQPMLLRAGQLLPLAKGDALREGDELQTAEQSSVYLRTFDQGFIAVRPNSVLLIEKYHLGKQGAASQFKFQLKTGLMRSVTGSEVQKDKDKYRLNTPVAAIGLRGTDFVVHANEYATQVAVQKGGVVIEAFSSACSVEQGGPCQGINSRELFASTAHMLEVIRGQAVPVQKDSSPVLQKELQKELPKEAVKDSKEVAKEGVKEPSKAVALGAESSTQAVDLTNAVAKPLIDGSKIKPTVKPTDPLAVGPTPTPVPNVLPTPAPTPAAPEPAIPLPLPKPSEPVVEVVVVPSIHWGRWQELANLPATASFSDIYKSGQEVVNAGIYYVMSRDNSNLQYGPELGVVNFQMAKHDGILVNTDSHSIIPTVAKESALQINFAAQSFSTHLLLNAAGREIPVNVKGAVESNGFFLNGAVSEVQLRGVVSGKEAAEAGYIYYSAPAANEILSGGTYWLRKR